jgi:hypothetical protein
MYRQVNAQFEIRRMRQMDGQTECQIDALRVRSANGQREINRKAVRRTYIQTNGQVEIQTNR